jgi:integrating conjugative element protein (TIGR03755 family)
LGLGYSCGKFDPEAAVTNILNQVAAGADAMMDAMVLAAQSAIAALPAYILQRANPGLYDLFQTALLKAEETLNLATKSCEAMEAEIAKGKDPFREWVILSKGQDWRYVMGTEDDIVQAKEEVEDTNGGNGVPWLGGMRGGRNQDPIEVVADTVRAGYNVTANNSADADSSSAPEGSRLGAVWPGSQDAIDWAQDVLGDVIVRTCEDCEPSGTPGIGLLPGVEKAQEEIAERLTDLVDGSQEPTRENLEEVSAPGLGIGINVELVKALRELPSDEQEILTGKLAAEAAQARVLEKTLLLRRLILSGRQVPEIIGSGPGQEVIDRKLSELDQEIDNLLFETKVRREVMAATAATILEEVQRRRGYSLGVPRTPRRDQNPYFDGAVPQASE